MYQTLHDSFEKIVNEANKEIVDTNSYLKKTNASLVEERRKLKHEISTIAESYERKIREAAAAARKEATNGFAIGDVVWFVSKVERSIPCEFCGSTGKIKRVGYGHIEECECHKCYGRKVTSVFVPDVKSGTISEIAVTWFGQPTHSSSKVYITGMGQKFSLNELYATEMEAREAMNTGKENP